MGYGWENNDEDLTSEDTVMGNRYILKFGKFGAYYFDTQTGKDLTLDDVLQLLNVVRA